MKISRWPTFSFITFLFTSIAFTSIANAKPIAVSGSVQDEKGNPAAGVIVESRYGARNYSTITGRDGRFTLQIEQGTIRFPQNKLMIPLLAKTGDGSMQAFVTADDEANRDKPLVLAPARQIEVTVNDAENHPVADAQVLVDASYFQVAQVATDAAGKATLKFPAKGSLNSIVATKPDVGLDYFIFWRGKGPRSDPYRLEQDATGPLTFTLNGMKNVSVHVTDEQDKPLAGVSVYPWLFEKPKKGDDVNISGLTYFPRRTDERGVAEFSVPIDQVRAVNFWAQLEGYTSTKRWLWDPKTADKQLEVKLIKQLRIVGRVIDIDSKPAAGAWVSINGASHESFDGVYHGIFTNDDGTFESLIDPDMYYMFLARKGQGASLPVLRMIHREVNDPVELTLEPGTLLQALITGGTDKKPLEGISVTLVQNDGGTYYKLPKEQQFPGKSEGRRAIYLSAARHATSDKNGICEFYIAPGHYQLSAYVPNESRQNAVQFELAGDGKYQLTRWVDDKRQKQQELAVKDEKMQINLHFQQEAPPPVLKGRVVLLDQPQRGVADAMLKGYSTDSVYPQGVSDRDGNFTLGRGKGQLYLQAANLDGTLKAIRVVRPDENDITIPLGPTASAHGRILDHEGKPMAKPTVEYGVKITHNGGTFSYNFGGSVVGTQEGFFTIEGLVPGFEYSINVATSFSDDGRPYSHTSAGKVKAEGVSRVELGDLKLPAPYRPKLAADYAAEAFNKTESFDQRLAAALRRAKLSYQNVMLVLGSPKSPATARFFVYRYDLRNAEFWNAMTDHWLIAVDTDKTSDELSAWADRNKIRLAGPGFVMAILDPDGKVLGQSSSEELSTDGQLDRKLVMEFARKHAPVMPDGKKLFDQATAEAKAQGKKVLLDVSGPYCGPCYIFSEYLEANQALIAQDYVPVTLDRRFAGVNEILKPYDAPTSTPWIAILSADGKILSTSDGPDGNVGFEKPQWEKMLKATASKLTAAQVGELVAKVKE